MNISECINIKICTNISEYTTILKYILIYDTTNRCNNKKNSKIN